MSAWLDALTHAPGALESFREWLVKHQTKASMAVEIAVESGDLEGARAALAQKNLLANMLSELGRSDREEQAYAAYRNGR